MNNTCNMLSGADSGSREHAIVSATLDALKQFTEADYLDCDKAASLLLDAVYRKIVLLNASRDTGTKWRIPTSLNGYQIYLLLSHVNPIYNIALTDDSSGRETMLGVYCTVGENAGIYETDESHIRQMIRQYTPLVSDVGMRDILAVFRDIAPVRHVCTDHDLIAVNNGIFNYHTKELMSFSPDYIFLSKSKVNYNPNATNVILHNDNDNTDWDVDSWMDELSDDAEVVHLLWQILGAIIRPNVRWNKSAWFYSEQGNNGKGTLCALMRNLCGTGSHTSLALSDMSKDFMLENVIGVSAIITDENDVGTYIDKAANLKAIVTGDMFLINRKFKQPIAGCFRGFMVQCLNEMPRIRDKSNSFYRRQIFIPFTKCFTGHERKYIKDDYLHRPEVLEYVLYKVLHMNYYDFDVPKTCQDALDSYKAFVDPVRSFVLDIFPRLSWKLLPNKFIYDLYKSWYEENYNDRGCVSRNVFLKDLRLLLPELEENWFDSGDKIVRPIGRMDYPEPLIAEFSLENWMNPARKNSRNFEHCMLAVLSHGYRGFYFGSLHDDSNVDDEDGDEECE